MTDLDQRITEMAREIAAKNIEGSNGLHDDAAFAFRAGALDDHQDVQAIVAAINRGIALERERCAGIADNLGEQSGEPWPGPDSARLHYWRDKAIKAAASLRAQGERL